MKLKFLETVSLNNSKIFFAVVSLVFGLPAWSAEQNTDPATGLPAAVATTSPATDMYHYTDDDEVELQAALTDYNLIEGEYENLSSQYTVISFKALDSGAQGCRIQIDGAVDDYFLYGYKAASDRYYSDVAVRRTGDYTYTTVNNSSRTIPSYTVCSSEELQTLSKKRLQAAQAKMKYSKLAKNKAIKIGNEKALKANIESAEKGEAYGLKRMAERYRKGEGVEKDLKKAESYSRKAEEAGETEEQRIAAARQVSEENANKEMFQRALRGVETGDYLSALTVARCYRDGKGTDKDLELALKYYEKVPVLKRNAPYNPVPDTYQFEIDEIKKQLKTGGKDGG